MALYVSGSLKWFSWASNPWENTKKKKQGSLINLYDQQILVMVEVILNIRNGTNSRKPKNGSKALIKLRYLFISLRLPKMPKAH